MPRLKREETGGPAVPKPGMSERFDGARLRTLRRRAGLSQAELAGDDISESYVSLLEAGRRRPTEETVGRLAKRLGCPPSELTFGAPGAPSLVRVELAIRRAEWETTSGGAARAVRRLREARAEPAIDAAPWLAARADIALAKALEATGQLEEALTAWEAAATAAEAQPEYGWYAEASVGVCRCARELGHLEYALEVGSQFWERASLSPRLAGVSDDDVVVIGATLLSIYLELGDVRSSTALADRLVALADTTATPVAIGAAYWNAAVTAEAQGKIGDALRLAERAAASFNLTSDARNKARLQTALGALHLRAQPPDPLEGLRLLTAAEPVLKQFASAVDVAYCQTELARAHLLLDEPHQAADLAASTVRDLESLGSVKLEQGRALTMLALANRTLGRVDEAARAAREATKLLESVGALRQAAAAWAELAEVCASLGDSPLALAAYRHATTLLGLSVTQRTGAQTSSDTRLQSG